MEFVLHLILSHKETNIKYSRLLCTSLEKQSHFELRMWVFYVSIPLNAHSSHEVCSALCPSAQLQTYYFKEASKVIPRVLK